MARRTEHPVNPDSYDTSKGELPAAAAFCGQALPFLIKRLVRQTPEPLTVPTNLNQVWSMGFMHDQLADGCSVRVFSVIDDFNREALCGVCRVGPGMEHKARIYPAGQATTECRRLAVAA